MDDSKSPTINVDQYLDLQTERQTIPPRDEFWQDSVENFGNDYA